MSRRRKVPSMPSKDDIDITLFLFFLIYAFPEYAWIDVTAANKRVRRAQQMRTDDEWQGIGFGNFANSADDAFYLYHIASRSAYNSCSRYFATTSQNLITRPEEECLKWRY